MSIEPGTLVEVIQDGKRGVVIPDRWDVCAPEETLVVLEDAEYGMGIDTEWLRVIGPDPAKADPQLCGAGKGEDACVFLGFGGTGGWQCLRFSSLRQHLLDTPLKAKRRPTV